MLYRFLTAKGAKYPKKKIFNLAYSALFAVNLFAAFPAFSQKPEASPALGKCWEHRAEDLNARGLAADSSSVYLAGSAGRIEALSAADGSRLWSADLGGEIVSNIAVNGSAVYIVTRTKGDKAHASLRSLSKSTGIANWIAEIPDAASFHLGLAVRQAAASADSSGGASYVIAAADTGLFTAVSPTGNPVWTRQMAPLAVDPAIDADRILVGTLTPSTADAGSAPTAEIAVLSTSTGEVTGSMRVPFRPTAMALIGDSRAAYGDERGNLLFFNAADLKTIWKIKHGGSISDIVPLEDVLIAASNDDFVYSTAYYNGGVRWKRRMADRAFRPALSSADKIAVALRVGGTALILKAGSGKAVDTVTLRQDDEFTLAPVVAGNTLVLVAGSGVSGYGCQKPPA